MGILVALLGLVIVTAVVVASVTAVIGGVVGDEAEED